MGVKKEVRLRGKLAKAAGDYLACEAVKERDDELNYREELALGRIIRLAQELDQTAPDLAVLGKAARA